MATGSIILRPYKDLSKGHTPSSGSSAYAMVSEAQPDDNATYIYQRITNKDVTSTSTKFSLSGSFPSVPYEVTNLSLIGRGMASAKGQSLSLTMALSFNGTQGAPQLQCTLNNAYSNSTIAIQNLIQPINEYLKNNNYTFSNNKFQVSVNSQGAKQNKKDDDFDIRITQIFVQMDYKTLEVPLNEKVFIKENNKYVTYSKAYKKINGLWESIPFATLFSSLSDGEKTNFVNKK